MVVSKIAEMFVSSAAYRGCPCGAKRFALKGAPTVSVVLQLATIGLKRRLRAKAVTVHCCDTCVRLIHTKRGRKLRNALAVALQSQMVDLQRKVKAKNAA
jgi:hypothetical protein